MNLRDELRPRAEPPTRRVPRFLTCLVKGPAGCLAFLLGAAAIGVLLLPAAGGRVLDRMGEGWFADHHAGELELGDAWFGSFYGPNQIERMILRDPSGEEILRGSLAGPSLAGIFDRSEHKYGPLRVQLELLRVIADEDGITNLERAFERDPSDEDLDERSDLTTDRKFEIELEVHVGRLRYTSERGREALLEDLYFHGQLEWGPRETDLVLEGGSDEASVAGRPWRLRLECERTEDGLARPWDVEIELENMPAVLARALCPALRPLARELGPLVDELHWTRKGSAVALDCVDGGARLAFNGVELDGLVSGTPEVPLELALPCAGPAGRALVERFLPPLAELACEADAAPHLVRLHAFQWPLDGDWERLEGEAELGFAPARATLRPFSADLPALVALLGPQPARLPLREGVLEYAGFQLPLEDGWLRLDGALELASGERTLGVSGEAGGKAIERVELSGEDDVEDGEAPALRLPPPPELPAQGAPEVPPAPQPDR